jgi:hypothetical protein
VRGTAGAGQGQESAWRWWVGRVAVPIVAALIGVLGVGRVLVIILGDDGRNPPAPPSTTRSERVDTGPIPTPAVETRPTTTPATVLPAQRIRLSAGETRHFDDHTAWVCSGDIRLSTGLQLYDDNNPVTGLVASIARGASYSVTAAFDGADCVSAPDADVSAVITRKADELKSGGCEGKCSTVIVQVCDARGSCLQSAR